MAVWDRYKPLLEHDYSRSVYMLSVDAKTYAHSKVSVLYIYVNYHIRMSMPELNDEDYFPSIIGGELIKPEI